MSDTERLAQYITGKTAAWEGEKSRCLKPEGRQSVGVEEETVMERTC